MTEMIKSNLKNEKFPVCSVILFIQAVQDETRQTVFSSHQFLTLLHTQSNTLKWLGIFLSMFS